MTGSILERSPLRRLRRSLQLGLFAAALGLPLTVMPASPVSPLPNLGDSGDLSLGAERRLGDRIAREIYRDPDYIDDALLEEYAQGVWQSLLAAARLRGEVTPEMDARLAFELLLIRDRSVNAFALPGGYMGLHLGMKLESFVPPDQMPERKEEVA